MARFKPIALICIDNTCLNQKWADTTTGQIHIFPLDYDPNQYDEGQTNRLLPLKSRR